jgi:tetraacyldisaccharide 4'-kinase
LNPLSAVYGRIAALRRVWYTRFPGMQYRLPCPVISVGNLVVGGSGKTPIVAAIAQLLLRQGERPVILSRGYRRRTRPEAIVVVSDGTRVLVPVHDSGDEPQMLARLLPDVPVVVCARRYRAGQEAMSRFTPTVMLLDDGFQHLQLARDIDLLVISPADFEADLLPAGTLREPIAAGSAADAVIVPGSLEEAAAVSSALGVARAFSAFARYEPFRSLADGAAMTIAGGTRVIGVAGIARPGRFFKAVESCDVRLEREISFHDHHWFSRRDVERVERSAREAQASLVVTTEKDAMRLAGMRFSMPWACLPMRMALTPESEVFAWLRQRLHAARQPAEAGARR